MNKDLLKQLKHQATSYTWNGDDVTEELDEDLFAKLIVRECLALCASDVEARLGGAPYETASDFDKGFMDGQDCCCEMIKEHFGVEE